ncbi:sensor histidine kinase [Nocardioides sp. MAH-18]|uniref:histidine kinase n=1 Tax=Nocardioides agri TaxID=2682843 RepID=A0A6L6XY49_9ACTN|nr:GAF domain-containing sensor histidine kinase [Nocardioides sp. CGMCC 1.13656]MBA2952471.1 sensor histidine kinase [Nocardioides sp. CGMCC 1.13656]MVQ51633.1 sensor histidine kinase [Nocardioides sp. MAH-18]
MTPAPAPGRVPATVVSVLAVGMLVVCLCLDLVNEPADRARSSMGWGTFSALAGVIAVGTAAPVLWRHPRHPVAWVLAGTGLLWSLDGLCESYSAYAMAQTPVLPLAGFAVWVVAQLGAFLLVGLPTVLVLYPNGRLMKGAWGTVSVLVIAMACALPSLLLFAPMSIVGNEEPLPMDTGMPELPLPEDVFFTLLRVARVVTLLAMPLAVAVLFARHRRADDRERKQIRWLVWAAVVCLVMAGLGAVLQNGWVVSIALVVALSVTGVSIAIGILDPDLGDVDALMGGTIVWATVAGLVIALDLVLVATLDALLGDRLDQRDATLILLLVAVTIYAPVRGWISGVVHRALVGRRGDRYEVVAALAARLEEAGDVRDQLPALATEVASAFKLDFVQVEVFGHGGGAIAATYGERPRDTREVPIRYGEEEVGRLELPARGVRSMLSKRDQALLFDIVRQAAMAVRSARLAADLQVSREQLVLAREEDRRRIRRDLHDGLGPVLGGVAMRLDAAGNALDRDPETTRRLVAQSRQDVTDALADVRRLVQGLRPPALDDLGLLAALDQQAERLSSADLAVDVAAEDLGPLSAAVEVAAYRIASEALTNAVRHAGARRASVRLVGNSHALLVEVSDDGAGIAADVVAGVGLRSIRERAAELGGRTEITCPDGGGTRVRAWLPTAPTPDLEETT